MKTLFVATSAVAVLLVTFSIVEKVTHSSSDDFGRLYSSREKVQRLVPQATLVTTPTPIVEGEIPDPLSIDAARRQQYLDVTPPPVAPTTFASDPISGGETAVTPTSEVQSPALPILKELKPGERVSISGGADGVRVAVSPPPAQGQAP